MEHKITISIIGRSGCGKGTQAKVLLRQLRKNGAVGHVETGKYLRAMLKKDTPTGLHVRTILKQGHLVPWWIPAYTWLKEMVDRSYTERHLVFDGSPRKLFEAQLLDEVMQWYGRSLPLCVYLDVEEKSASNRLLKRGRADDTPAAIAHRMEFFNTDVLPVVEYYKAQGRLIHIDGNPAPKMVWKEINKKLSEKLGKQWPRSRILT